MPRSASSGLLAVELGPLEGYPQLWEPHTSRGAPPFLGPYTPVSSPPFPPPTVIFHGNKRPVLNPLPCDPHFHLALFAARQEGAENLSPPPERYVSSGAFLNQRSSAFHQSQQMHLDGTQWLHGKQRLLSLTEHMLLPASLFQALRTRHTSWGKKKCCSWV